jgi:hypothetical protein
MFEPLPEKFPGSFAVAVRRQSGEETQASHHIYRNGGNI